MPISWQVADLPYGETAGKASLFVGHVCDVTILDAISMAGQRPALRGNGAKGKQFVGHVCDVTILDANFMAGRRPALRGYGWRSSPERALLQVTFSPPVEQNQAITKDDPAKDLTPEDHLLEQEI
jgi:hypothetical protein